MATASENLAAVQRAYKALALDDWDGFLESFHPEVQLIEADSLPYGGTYFGIKNARRAIETAIATWEDFDFHLEEIACNGNLVFVYLHMLGKGRKTGKSFSIPLTEVWRFRDGKVVEFRPFYFDTARVAECYG